MKSKKAKKRKLKEMLEKKSSLTGRKKNGSKKDSGGNNGIKTKNNWDKPKAIAEFRVTKKENKRRKLRQVRSE